MDTNPILINDLILELGCLQYRLIPKQCPTPSREPHETHSAICIIYRAKRISDLFRQC
jgi:hypothetical protein